MQRRLLPFLVLVVGLLAAVGATIWINSPVSPAKTSAIGGAFSLIDENGAQVTEAVFKNKVSLVFFGYTHCPDVCPTTLYDMSQILAKIPPNAPITAAFISVDPERDTPASLKDYLSSFDPRIHAFSGPRPNIEAAMKAYRVYAKKVQTGPTQLIYDYSWLCNSIFGCNSSNPSYFSIGNSWICDWVLKCSKRESDDYTYDHTALVYLMDKSGNFVTGLDLKRPPDDNVKELAGYFQ